MINGPNLILLKPVLLTSSGIRTKVTLVSIGSLETIGLLLFKMEGQIELCTKVCTIAAELHKTIRPLQTSQNCTHVHPGERRGAHRKILTEVLTKILIFFIYIPSSLRQSTSISLYLKSFYKLQAASYSTLQAQKRERHLMTSMDIFLLPHIKAVSQYLCFVDQIVDSIFLYLIVSCCVLLQLNLT